MYRGTYSPASGPIPPELVDHELFSEFHWSWEDLERTPILVKRVQWDILQVRRAAEQERMEDAQRDAERAARAARH